LSRWQSVYAEFAWCAVDAVVVVATCIVIVFSCALPAFRYLYVFVSSARTSLRPLLGGGGKGAIPKNLAPQQVPGEAARKRFSGRGYLPRTGVPHWGSLQLSPASYLVGEEAGYPFPIPPPRSRPFGPRASALAPGPKKRGLASQHDGLGAPLLRLVADGCAFVV